MAGSVNKVILVGNLGADPEVRQTQDGRPIVNLRLATSESWRDKGTGERKERTEWHRVVIFNENLARVAEQYLKKGSKVYIEGQLQTRKWQDQSGQDRYSTEVVLQQYRGELTMLMADSATAWAKASRVEEETSAAPGRSAVAAAKAGEVPSTRSSTTKSRSDRRLPQKKEPGRRPGSRTSLQSNRFAISTYPGRFVRRPSPAARRASDSPAPRRASLCRDRR